MEREINKDLNIEETIFKNDQLPLQLMKNTRNTIYFFF